MARDPKARGVRVARSVLWLVLAVAVFPAAAGAATFPIHSTWDQPGGPGSPLTLTYSFSNLFDGDFYDPSVGAPIPVGVLRSAFELAFWDYAAILPVHFVEVADAGPPPESGEYDPAGLADIRIGAVPHIDDANAYAYFPLAGSGLAGDIVFNRERSGFGWSQVFFYAVAQHELGHSLGMGHAIEEGVAGGSGASASSTYTGPIIPLAPGMIVALQGAYGVGTGSVTPLSAPEPTLFWLLATSLGALARRRASVQKARGQR